uniref:Disease resistance R13L4/SHOC-2-like LRR domain-containing protein n=1 Tax=Chromera velia CCMP2878 TaxID=1169474 RepID=A0A0G4HCY3_9ALVE|eukprot:Cvel_26191.t1-p1 / transcript=Cvel_26191.t1 / gene=Cvel_26191 / organism=Chromera_velia_CCMP2878 / gene_product=Leucine-rich repeat protein soc-2 homolog, putative / transcript_product=Leucine-rich repeat protein soc-2 homolog, putative / location=Cvel_scaffold3081:1439-8240(+) / protein_length=1625 / sequence_SO=supercontig / SO=protein_coding / is_pseudo=false
MGAVCSRKALSVKDNDSQMSSNRSVYQMQAVQKVNGGNVGEWWDKKEGKKPKRPAPQSQSPSKGIESPSKQAKAKKQRAKHNRFGRKEAKRRTSVANVGDLILLKKYLFPEKTLEGNQVIDALRFEVPEALRSSLSEKFYDSIHELDDKKLNSICIRRCRLPRFPRNLHRCKDLKSLDLSHNLIQEIPLDLVDIHSLDASEIEIIILEFNHINEITVKTLEKLENLRYLDLSNNYIGELPHDFGRHLKKLETLDLSVNSLSSLPDSVSECSKLKLLQVENNKLTAVPRLTYTKHVNGRDVVYGLLELERLLLSFNQIDSVPSTIRHLKKLRTLRLVSNQITHLPPEILELFDDQTARAGGMGRTGEDADLDFQDNEDNGCLQDLFVDHNPLKNPPIAAFAWGWREAFRSFKVDLYARPLTDGSPSASIPQDQIQTLQTHSPSRVEDDAPIEDGAFVTGAAGVGRGRRRGKIKWEEEFADSVLPSILDASAASTTASTSVRTAGPPQQQGDGVGGQRGLGQRGSVRGVGEDWGGGKRDSLTGDSQMYGPPLFFLGKEGQIFLWEKGHKESLEPKSVMLEYAKRVSTEDSGTANGQALAVATPSPNFNRTQSVRFTTAPSDVGGGTRRESPMQGGGGQVSKSTRYSGEETERERATPVAGFFSPNFRIVQTMVRIHKNKLSLWEGRDFLSSGCVEGISSLQGGGLQGAPGKHRRFSQIMNGTSDTADLDLFCLLLALLCRRSSRSLSSLFKAACGKLEDRPQSPSKPAKTHADGESAFALLSNKAIRGKRLQSPFKDREPPSSAVAVRSPAITTQQRTTLSKSRFDAFLESRQLFIPEVQRDLIWRMLTTSSDERDDQGIVNEQVFAAFLLLFDALLPPELLEDKTHPRYHFRKRIEKAPVSKGGFKGVEKERKDPATLGKELAFLYMTPRQVVDGMADRLYDPPASCHAINSATITGDPCGSYTDPWKELAFSLDAPIFIQQMNAEGGEEGGIGGCEDLKGRRDLALSTKQIERLKWGSLRKDAADTPNSFDHLSPTGSPSKGGGLLNMLKGMRKGRKVGTDGSVLTQSELKKEKEENDESPTGGGKSPAATGLQRLNTLTRTGWNQIFNAVARRRARALEMGSLYFGDEDSDDFEMSDSETDGENSDELEEWSESSLSFESIDGDLWETKPFGLTHLAMDVSKKPGGLWGEDQDLDADSPRNVAEEVWENDIENAIPDILSMVTNGRVAPLWAIDNFSRSRSPTPLELHGVSFGLAQKIPPLSREDRKRVITHLLREETIDKKEALMLEQSMRTQRQRVLSPWHIHDHNALQGKGREQTLKAIPIGGYDNRSTAPKDPLSRVTGTNLRLTAEEKISLMRQRERNMRESRTRSRAVGKTSVTSQRMVERMKKRYKTDVAPLARVLRQVRRCVAHSQYRALLQYILSEIRQLRNCERQNASASSWETVLLRVWDPNLRGALGDTVSSGGPCLGRELLEAVGFALVSEEIWIWPVHFDMQASQETEKVSQKFMRAINLFWARGGLREKDKGGGEEEVEASGEDSGDGGEGNSFAMKKTKKKSASTTLAAGAKDRMAHSLQMAESKKRWLDKWIPSNCLGRDKDRLNDVYLFFSRQIQREREKMGEQQE